MTTHKRIVLAVISASTVLALLIPLAPWVWHFYIYEHYREWGGRLQVIDERLSASCRREVDPIHRHPDLAVKKDMSSASRVYKDLRMVFFGGNHVEYRKIHLTLDCQEQLKANFKSYFETEDTITLYY